MAYTPLALANTFLAKHGADGWVDHMKLQKLAYYGYGWWLAFHEEPLLVEGPEVWRYGPVFSSMYNVLASRGTKRIVEPVRAVPFGGPHVIPPEDKEANDMADWVWGQYGGLSSMKLSDMTHEKGTPWQIEAEAKGYRVPKHHRIPDDRIRAYFRECAAQLGN